MELHFPVILDGATGTELQKVGFDGSMATEQWILEHPDAIKNLHNAYISAGSDIVLAPTFSANRVKLEEHRLFNCVDKYNKALLTLAKDNAGGRAYTAADISPTGRFLAPLGDMSFEELVDVYTEQAKALEEAGAELYIIETMMTVSDARAAVLAVRSVSTKPIFVTFTADANGKSISGSDIVAVLRIMQGMDINAFGLNCSCGPEEMLVQLKRLSEYAEVPLIAKPNAGLPEIVDGKTVYNCPPEEFVRWIPQFAKAGVAIFGGCCGSTPEHIRALTKALEGIQIKAPSPAHKDVLPLATEKELFDLPADVSFSKVIDCSASLADDLAEAEDDAAPVAAVKIAAPEDLDFFAESQYAVTKPLCIVCEDAALLEKALRIYQGRAMYDGNLPENVLADLSKKYGLVY